MNISYFLGANSYHGFHSLYDDFISLSTIDRLFIIKGGAGCGKSTFMKAIASAASSAGFDVERVLCSGDPDSLDGIYIPGLRIAYVDGTAPHAAVTTREKRLELMSIFAIINMCMLHYRQPVRRDNCNISEMIIY